MLKIAVLDSGGLSADQWRAAIDRLAGVTMVDVEAADAVVVADVEAAKDVSVAGRVAVVVPGSLGGSAEAASLPEGTMLAATGRFAASIQEVQAVNQSGQLGEPGLLRIHRWVPGGGRVRVACLADQLDLATWLFGGMPTEVYAVRRGDNGEYVHVHLGFADDGMALIDVATTLPDGEDYYALSLIGRNGSVYADDHHNMHLVYSGGAPQGVRGGEGVVGLVNLLGELAGSVSEGRAPVPGPADAVRALVVAEAAERSIEAGAPLEINESGDGYELG